MQSVFISGATSGIGFAAAIRFDALGWQVYAAALPDDDFAPLIAQTSDRLTPLLLDITDHGAVTKLTDHIQRLDALVNNAGVQLPGVIEGIPDTKIRQQFDVNVFGHLAVTRTLLPTLRQSDSPRLIFVTSLMGKVAMPTLGIYSMTKHALEGLVDTLRLELAAQNIHVAAVEPGAVQTAMLDAMPRLMQEAHKDLSPEIAALYADLIDNMQDALTTQTDTASPVDDVVNAIIHAATSDTPKTRYGIGLPIRGLMLMRRLAPDTVGDAILKRALGLP